MVHHLELPHSFPKKETFEYKGGVELNLENVDAQESSLLEQFKHALSKDAADQLIFVLRTFQQDDFINHCNIATQTLGERLNTSFGDEGSFFDEAPPTPSLMYVHMEVSIRQGGVVNFIV
jgi:hypothetical protein